MDAKQPNVTEQFQSSAGSYELVLSAVLFGLFGLWLDSRLGTTPWIAVVATVAGFAGAALSLFYRYRADIARLEARRDAANAEREALLARSARLSEAGS